MSVVSVHNFKLKCSKPVERVDYTNFLGATDRQVDRENIMLPDYRHRGIKSRKV